MRFLEATWLDFIQMSGFRPHNKAYQCICSVTTVGFPPHRPWATTGKTLGNLTQPVLVAVLDRAGAGVDHKQAHLARSVGGGAPEQERARAARGVIQGLILALRMPATWAIWHADPQCMIGG